MKQWNNEAVSSRQQAMKQWNNEAASNGTVEQWNNEAASSKQWNSGTMKPFNIPLECQ